MSKYEDPFEAFKKKKDREAQAKKAEKADGGLDRFRVQLANSNLQSHRYAKLEGPAAPPPAGYESTRIADPAAGNAPAGPEPEGMERIRPIPAEAAAPPPEGFDSGRFRSGEVARPDKPAGFESGRFDR